MSYNIGDWSSGMIGAPKPLAGVRFSHPLLLEESEMLYLQAFLAFLFLLENQRVSKRYQIELKGVNHSGYFVQYPKKIKK